MGLPGEVREAARIVALALDRERLTVESVTGEDHRRVPAVVRRPSS